MIFSDNTPGDQVDSAHRTAGDDQFGCACVGQFETLDAMCDARVRPREVLAVVQTDAGSVYLPDEGRGELLLAVSAAGDPSVATRASGAMAAKK